ncbi:MAG: hypothetical protein ABIJ48_09450 [Actinomycetota bacterium]
MAVRRFDPGVMRRWMVESCARQGVEVTVTEVEVLGRVSALLREGRRPQLPAPHTPPPGPVGS